MTDIQGREGRGVQRDSDSFLMCQEARRAKLASGESLGTSRYRRCIGEGEVEVEVEGEKSREKWEAPSELLFRLLHLPRVKKDACCGSYSATESTYRNRGFGR